MVQKPFLMYSSNSKYKPAPEKEKSVNFQYISSDPGVSEIAVQFAIQLSRRAAKNRTNFLPALHSQKNGKLWQNSSARYKIVWYSNTVFVDCPEFFVEARCEKRTQWRFLSHRNVGEVRRRFRIQRINDQSNFWELLQCVEKCFYCIYLAKLIDQSSQNNDVVLASEILKVLFNLYINVDESRDEELQKYQKLVEICYKMLVNRGSHKITNENELHR